MSAIESLIFLLGAAALLTQLARVLRVPYPVFLVLGGLAIGFVPGLPAVNISPDVIFLVFLPPLLSAAAFFSSPRELREHLTPITLLAVGLVLFTTVLTALGAHFLIGMPWAVAFVLGAILSPTDPVVAEAVFRRLGVPGRVRVILEGESLVNDGTGLVAYRLAVAAVVTGAFSIWLAGLQFVVGAVGGVAAGFAVGRLVVWARRHLAEDPSVQNIVSLLTPFVAYLAAEELPHGMWERLHALFGVPADLHFSGVLAVVTTGLYLGRKGPYITSSGTRLQGFATWELITFLLNGLIFILIGLQLGSVVEGLDNYTAVQLASYAVLVSLTVIVVRVLWVFPATYLPRRISRRIRERDPSPPWRSVSIVAWTGMRGVISLAAALALPLETTSGVPFPGRDLIIFLTFCVILATLVVQGLSLPAVIRALGLEDDRIGEKEETHGRIQVAEAAIERLDELVDEDWVREDTVERIRGMYTYRRNRFASRFDGDPDGVEERSAAYQRLMVELLGAQRERLVRMRDEGSIGDEIMHRIERDLDLEESRLEL